MKVPYNHVHASGDILFAARGGKILSFSLLNGSHISTWKHPDLDKAFVGAGDNAAVGSEEASAANPDTGSANEEQERPVKRQKVDGQDSAAVAEGQASNLGGHLKDAAKLDQKEGQTQGKKNKKNKGDSGKDHSKVSRAADRPAIIQMKSSPDGKHLLAVSGSDKTLWVFGHDGEGHMTQLSHRTMPKRPSSVIIAPDSQIISADKFGDVYSLPLLVTDSGQTGAPGTSSLSSFAKPAFKLSANTLTVHSKRNLIALEHQQRQMELNKQSKDAEAARGEAKEFELTLLLGHVSMLTDMLLVESEGRRYILTGDRDEHIRVSRYIPQAHVIEGYCLGHKEFVNSIILPATKEALLVSGGGDPDLFSWDWKTGKLLSKTSLLRLAQEIRPETTKVAVSGLATLLYPTESGDLSYVLAICESIKAIFSWQVDEDNSLNHPGIIQLPGNPLSFSIAPVDDAPPKIIVAIDPGEPALAKGIHVFTLTMNKRRLAVDADSTVRDDELDGEEPDIPESQVRELLYNTENLRKEVTSREGKDEEVEDRERDEADAGAAAEEAPQEQT